jgi:hypothetical protein
LRKATEERGKIPERFELDDGLAARRFFANPFLRDNAGSDGLLMSA